MSTANPKPHFARERLALVALVTLAAVAVGCSGFGGRRWAEHPVTVTELVILSQHGVAPEKIIAKMRRGGTVYHLGEAQYAELRAKGVTPVVIAYMQQSHAEAVRSFPKLADDKDLSCWSLGFDGFWYLGGPYGLHPDC
jgi:hypothetical protein